MSCSRMWCRHCQQEVPAIASQVSGPLVCPRCEFVLTDALRQKRGSDSLEDAGIELTELDAPKIVPLREVFDSKQVQAELAQLGRRLSATSPVAAEELSPALDLVRQPLEIRRSTPPKQAQPLATYAQHRTPTGWWLSTLLAVSGLTLAVGLVALIYSTIATQPGLWNQALAMTLTGEGGLIVGLAWMASRLWRNSRQLNRQLAGVDRQLDALQFATEQRPGYDSAYYRRVA
ncbi:MAG: hypothetical protein RH917_19880 [Lacipirellulaceae bacterium]